MDSIFSTEVILAIVSTLFGGIAWLVKRYFAARDADKAEMKQDINDLKDDVRKTNKKVNDIAGIIIGCDHPDCPSRKLLSEYMQK